MGPHRPLDHAHFRLPLEPLPRGSWCRDEDGGLLTIRVGDDGRIRGTTEGDMPPLSVEAHRLEPTETTVFVIRFPRRNP